MNRKWHALQDKARSMVEAVSKVTSIHGGKFYSRWHVWSESGETYTVTQYHNSGNVSCNCKWHQYHPDLVCSHELAAVTPAGYTVKVHGKDDRAEQVARRSKRKVMKVAECWVTFRKVGS